MKNILYIGNNLSNKTSNISGIKVLSALLKQEGFTIYTSSSKNNKVLRLIDMVFTCFTTCKKVDYVLIDTYSTQNFYYALVVSQICRWFKTDYIPILHGGKLPERLKQNPQLCHKLFANAKSCVAPSNFLKKAFESYGYSNIIHIPNTIQIENYNFKERDYESLNILWVRSFSKIYNPEMAVRVVYKLKRSYPEVTLCMVGPDADNSRVQVEELARDLDVNVTFTGKLKKAEWIRLSEDYNVFINTTNFDNTPLSLIEAMALGLPVVSTNVGGIPYLIEDKKHGLLVAQNDVDAMANAITHLMVNKTERQLLVSNARQKVESFDWNSVKDVWLKLLSS